VCTHENITGCTHLDHPSSFPLDVEVAESQRIHSEQRADHAEHVRTDEEAAMRLQAAARVAAITIAQSPPTAKPAGWFREAILSALTLSADFASVQADLKHGAAVIAAEMYAGESNLAAGAQETAESGALRVSHPH
jgi:predicted phage tail protein